MATSDGYDGGCCENDKFFRGLLGYEAKVLF